MRSEVFQSKVQSDPNNPLLRFSLGQALFSEERYAEAVPHLEFCCNHRDDWMMAKILLGKAQLHAGNSETAKALLQSALALAIAQHHEGPEAEIRALLQDIA